MKLNYSSCSFNESATFKFEYQQISSPNLPNNKWDSNPKKIKIIVSFTDNYADIRYCTEFIDTRGKDSFLQQ